MIHILKEIFVPEDIKHFFLQVLFWNSVGALIVILVSAANPEGEKYLLLAAKQADSMTLWNVVACIGISVSFFSIMIKDLMVNSINNYCIIKITSRISNITEYISERLLNACIDIASLAFGIVLCETFTKYNISNVDIFGYLIVGISIFVFLYILVIVTSLRLFSLHPPTSGSYKLFFKIPKLIRRAACLLLIITPIFSVLYFPKY